MSVIDEEEDEVEEQENSIYSFIKYSILTFCILATSYRIYLNYQTYIEYKVIINSKVEMSEEETLPQLSICFYEIINEEKLDLVNSSLKEEFHHSIDDPTKFREWKNKNFSLKKLFDLSYKFEDYFINCSYLAQDAINNLNCSNFYTVSLSSTKKCFNFFHRPKETQKKPDKWFYNRILLQNRPWVRLFVKKEFLVHKKKMDVIVNPYFSVQNNDKSNRGFKSYTTDYTQSIFVSYDCRKSLRLEKPYETRCFDYYKLGYFDRQHCVYECKVKNLLYNGGNWTEELTVNRSLTEMVEEKNLTFNYVTDLKDDCETNKCFDLDCESKEYQLINKYHKLDVDTISKEIDVRLYLNSVPMSSLEYQALYPLGNSFVQMFIGPASLWLGLSIFSFSKLIFWFLCEITNRKSKKKPTELNLDDHSKSSTNFNTSNQANFKDYNTNYDQNFSAFYLDNNLAKSIYDQDKKDKNMNESFDRYHKRSNKNLLQNSSKLNSPITNSLFNNKTYPINSISQLSPSIYRVGLDMYPKKNLKIKKTIEEDVVLKTDNLNENLETNLKGKSEQDKKEDDKSKEIKSKEVKLKEVKIKEDKTEEDKTKEIKSEDEKSKNSSNDLKTNKDQTNKSWLFKLVDWKNKLINLLFKSNQKVHPNLSSRTY